VAAVGFVVVRIELFLVPEAPELAQCTAVVGLERDGGDDDPLPRCSCWSLLQRMHFQREVQERGPRDILEEVLLEQIHRRHSTGALVGAGAAAGVAGLAPC
jgi:hypothetical protein